MAGLLKYFKPKQRHEDNDDEEKPKGLPDPNGDLSKVVPSSSIEVTNAVVRQALEKEGGPRGPYISVTPAQKYAMGQRAAENGVTATLCYYAKRFPNLQLKETTVRRFKNNYLASLKTPASDTKELLSKKRGRPLLIGEELDEQVRHYITFMRKEGTVINRHVVIAVGKGILMSHGKSEELTKDWARYVLQRMGMVKRKANTKAKVTVEDFDDLKKLFLMDIKSAVQIDEIPAQLIVNWDQTGINYIPVSNWTMEQAGSKRVEIVGKDDKRQITALFGCTMSGDFLPPQLVYQGKTNRCLPWYTFPSSWDITFTENHWCNKQTTHRYIVNILLPYLTQKKMELKVVPDQRALLMFDNFKGQCTEALLKLLDENNVSVVFIPPNCTDRLQPLDVSVNKSAKEFLRRKFHVWYAENVCAQLEGKLPKQQVDLRLNVVKPLGAKWMVELFDYIKSKPDVISNGFKKSGIFDIATPL